MSDRHKEDAHLVATIRASVKDHWHSNVLPKLRASETKMAEDKEHYKEEMSVLMSLSRFGMYEGAMAFAACFVTMRVLMPRLLSRMGSSSSGGGGDANPFLAASPMDGPSKAVKLLLDLSCSMVAGTYAAIYLTDRSEMIHKLSQVPLVSGRSVLASEFCGLMQQQLRQRPEHYWKTAQNAYLVEAYNFSLNCEKRQAMEKILRQELGLAKEDAISIPIGGVPLDYQVEEGALSDEPRGLHLSEMDENEDWASDFVTDQGED
jgi:hypothetical protein